MQNVSFQGKTNLVISNKLYNEIVDNAVSARHELVKKDIKLVPSRAFSLDVTNQDMIVVVRGDREGIIKKFSRFENLDNIISGLLDKIDKLKVNAKSKLTALIIGGKPNDAKTIDAVNTVGEILCDRPDIDTSILTGSKVAFNNKVIVRGKIGETDVIFPKIKGVEDVDDVEKVFDIAELNNTKTVID